MKKCVNITNGLRVYNDGTAMFCCLSTEKLTDKNGEIASVKDTPISEIQKGTKATEIKQSFDDGIQHANCRRCWQEEESGLESKRIRDNREFEHLEENSNIKIIELNLGTTCNLKCRICGPWSSSQWNKEFLKIGTDKIDIKSYNKWLQDLNHSYDDSSLFWQEFKKILPTVEKIDIYGGEPFLVKKQWEMLEYSVEQGYSVDQSLSFNTNGTVYDEDKINTMKQFKSVDISFSIDAIGKQFEYQRHPAKWNLVLSNLKKYQKLAQLNNWQVKICITVNNYNVFYLEEILDFFEKHNFDYYLNFLHDPKRNCITNLPEEIKKELTLSFNNNKISAKTKYWLPRVSEYMNTAPCHGPDWKMFKLITAQLDKIRNESFEEIFSKFYSKAF
jgi:sulfatase maturation enzyme AslB (radical SAM superfamily)